MSRDWEQDRELGWGAALRVFVGIVRVLGPRVGRVLLVPIWAYFLLTQRAKRAHSRAYLRRVLKREPTLRDIGRHFWAFARVALDRIYILGDSERGFAVEIEGLDSLAAALDEGHGCVLIGAHMGSFDIARVVQRRRPEIELRVLINRARTHNAEAILEALNPQLAGQIIDASGEPTAVALAMAGALRDGSIVGLLADRVGREGQAVGARFLGDEARFALAPLALASASRAPVLLFFGLFLGGDRYRVIFERIEFERGGGRRRRAALAALAQQYADRLETYCLRYPYNWFNFYDYWAIDED